MNQYESALNIMEKLFAKDCQFSLATVDGDIPSVRIIDAYFMNGAFYIVTYANTRKMIEIEKKHKCSNV